MNRMMSVELPEPKALVGTFRRFGPVGPVYQVTDVIRELDDGDVLLSVTIVESGEEAEYRYSHVLDDPKEA